MLLSYYRRPLFLLLLIYTAGIFVFRGRLLRSTEGLPFALPLPGALIEGRVAEYPIAVRGGWRFTLEMKKLYNQPFSGGLMVYAGSLEGVSYGDTVSFLGDLEAPRGAEVPGSLDWADYLAKRGITAQARAYSLETIKPAGLFIRLARRFREASLKTFESALPPEPAAVFGGIVLGEKRSVPPDLKTAFQDSGAMHLLVASGSNVGFVVAVVYFLCARFGLRRRHAGLAALLLSGFYVMAAGFDTPLVRAYCMFAAGLGAYLLKREAGAFHALTVAALLVLLFAPRAIFDAGFQMSFLAAYGLTVGMTVWRPYLRVAGLAGKALDLLTVSFFAQLLLYPILAVYFHKISLVSLLSNMVLVPASAVAMGLGFLLTALARAGFIFNWVAAVSGGFMGFFIGTVRFFAALPFSSVRVAEPSAWFTAGFFILALVLLHAPLLGFRRPRLYLSALAGLAVMGVGPLTRVQALPGARREYKAVLFGDSNTHSALVSEPSGALYLVNPGVNGKKLAAAVFSSGARTLEAVMLTSAAEKNFSGLAELAGLVKIKDVLVPYGPQPQALKRLLSGLAQGGTRVSQLWPGETPAAGLNLVCRWDSYSPGYSGPADVYGWEIGPLEVRRDGEYAGRLCPGCAGTASVAAQKGKTVELAFEVMRPD